MNVTFVAILVALLLAVVLLLPPVGVLLNRPGPKTDIHPPRPVDYLTSMKSVDTAETTLERIERGKLRMTIKHDVIKGVTPEMLVWWFRNFPDRTHPVNGEDIPWYQLWHPVDHVDVTVYGEDGSEVGSFSEGARLDIDEQLGPDYALPGGTFTVQKLDETGIVLTMDRGLLRLGRLEHQFIPVETGTRYESELVVGTDWPLMGRYVNFWVTSFVFTEEVGRAWFKHNVEEVGNFQFFLPDLYAEYGPGQSP